MASHLIRTYAPLSEHLLDLLVAREVAAISFGHRFFDFPKLSFIQFDENLYGFRGERRFWPLGCLGQSIEAPL